MGGALGGWARRSESGPARMNAVTGYLVQEFYDF